jgi:hypothetical protein
VARRQALWPIGRRAILPRELARTGATSSRRRDGDGKGVWVLAALIGGGAVAVTETTIRRRRLTQINAPAASESDHARVHSFNEESAS